MKAKIILWAIVLVIVLIQFIPVTRSNPAATAPLDDSLAVTAVLKQSCYDCHSNETVWPWYAYVAPVSWLVTSDVNEARHHFNFSEWGNLPLKKQKRVADHAVEEVEEGGMPPGNYLWMHGNAKMTPEDITTLKAWAQQVQGDSLSTTTEEEEHD